jgi:hypothetical protein
MIHIILQTVLKLSGFVVAGVVYGMVYLNYSEISILGFLI